MQERSKYFPDHMENPPKTEKKRKEKKKKKNTKPVTTHPKEGLLAAIKFLNPIFTELSLSHFKQKKLMKHSHRISYMDFVTIGYSLSESSPPGGSEAKASLCNVGDLGSIPGKIPWRRKWQPTPVLLPGKSHGCRSLVGYSPWGCKESDTTKRLLSSLTRVYLPLLPASRKQLYYTFCLLKILLTTYCFNIPLLYAPPIPTKSSSS